MDSKENLTEKVKNAMIELNSKCRVCGEPLRLERGKVYTAQNNLTGIAAFAGGVLSQYDAVDCPHCGCQNILCERKPKTAAPEPEEKRPESGLNDLAAEIHENALAHGWWDEPRTFPEILALCHSELSEALEQYRDGKPELYCANDKHHGGACTSVESGACSCLNGDCGEEKPSGIAVELADTVIRILDYCGHEGIDIEDAIRRKLEYNKTRPYKHGGKVC